MSKPAFIHREVIVFRRFRRKGYALFACLGREVVIGVLSAFTLAHATAKGVSIKPIKADTIAAATEKEMALGEVSVTGTRAPLTSGRSVRMVSVLTRADIAATPAQSVNDLLKLVAGVDVRQRGPLGAQADVSIRGGNNEQIALLLNGINICDPQTGHNSFDFPVSISDIERIEVLRGPAGRLYGTSSLTGAINIVTSPFPHPSQSSQSSHFSQLSHPSHYSLAAEASAGSYGYALASARVAMASRAVGGSLSGSYARSDGYSRNRAGGLNADYSGGKAFFQGRYVADAMALRWHAGMSVKGCGSNTFYGAAWDDQYEHTLKTFAALQAETHVYNQQRGMRAVLKDYGTALMAWGPLAQGRPELFAEPLLQEIGARHGLNAAQTALAFLTSQGICAIPKTLHKERLEQNLQAADVTLSAEEITALTALDHKYPPAAADFNDPELTRFLLSYSDKFKPA